MARSPLRRRLDSSDVFTASPSGNATFSCMQSDVFATDDQQQSVSPISGLVFLIGSKLKQINLTGLEVRIRSEAVVDNNTGIQVWLSEQTTYTENSFNSSTFRKIVDTQLVVHPKDPNRALVPNYAWSPIVLPRLNRAILYVRGAGPFLDYLLNATVKAKEEALSNMQMAVYAGSPISPNLPFNKFPAKLDKSVAPIFMGKFYMDYDRSGCDPKEPATVSTKIELLYVVNSTLTTPDYRSIIDSVNAEVDGLLQNDTVIAKFSDQYHLQRNESSKAYFRHFDGQTCIDQSWKKCNYLVVEITWKHWISLDEGLLKFQTYHHAPKFSEVIRGKLAPAVGRYYVGYVPVHGDFTFTLKGVLSNAKMDGDQTNFFVDNVRDFLNSKIPSKTGEVFQLQVQNQDSVTRGLRSLANEATIQLSGSITGGQTAVQQNADFAKRIDDVIATSSKDLIGFLRFQDFLPGKMAEQERYKFLMDLTSFQSLVVPNNQDTIDMVPKADDCGTANCANNSTNNATGIGNGTNTPTTNVWFIVGGVAGVTALICLCCLYFFCCGCAASGHSKKKNKKGKGTRKEKHKEFSTGSTCSSSIEEEEAMRQNEVFLLMNPQHITQKEPRPKQPRTTKPKKGGAPADIPESILSVPADSLLPPIRKSTAPPPSLDWQIQPQRPRWASKGPLQSPTRTNAYLTPPKQTAPSPSPHQSRPRSIGSASSNTTKPILETTPMSKNQQHQNSKGAIGTSSLPETQASLPKQSTPRAPSLQETTCHRVPLSPSPVELLKSRVPGKPCRSMNGSGMVPDPSQSMTKDDKNQLFPQDSGELSIRAAPTLGRCENPVAETATQRESSISGCSVNSKFYETPSNRTVAPDDSLQEPSQLPLPSRRDSNELVPENRQKASGDRGLQQCEAHSTEQQSQEPGSSSSRQDSAQKQNHSRKNSMAAALRSNASSGKPRLARREMLLMPGHELRGLMDPHDAYHPPTKEALVDHLIQVGAVDLVVCYKMSTLQQMTSAQLCKCIKNAGVSFDANYVVEKKDLIRVFLASGKLRILPEDVEPQSPRLPPQQREQVQRPSTPQDTIRTSSQKPIVDATPLPPPSQLQQQQCPNSEIPSPTRNPDATPPTQSTFRTPSEQESTCPARSPYPAASHGELPPPPPFHAEMQKRRVPRKLRLSTSDSSVKRARSRRGKKDDRKRQDRGDSAEHSMTSESTRSAPSSLHENEKTPVETIAHEASPISERSVNKRFFGSLPNRRRSENSTADSARQDDSSVSESSVSSWFYISTSKRNLAATPDDPTQEPSRPPLFSWRSRRSSNELVPESPEVDSGRGHQRHEAQIKEQLPQEPDSSSSRQESPELYSRKNSMVAALRPNASSGKPRLARREMLLMSVDELRGLMDPQDVYRPPNKEALVDHLIQVGAVDLVVCYKMSTLQQMTSAQLREFLKKAGVLFDANYAVEKKDLIRVFFASGKLRIIPEDAEPQSPGLPRGKGSSGQLQQPTSPHHSNRKKSRLEHLRKHEPNSPSIKERKNSLGIVTQEATSGKQFTRDKLMQMDAKELRTFLTDDPSYRPLDKMDLVNHLIETGAVELIVCYKLSTLFQMSITQLKQCLDDAKISYDSRFVVEKKDLIRIFQDSGKLRIIPE